MRTHPSPIVAGVIAIVVVAGVMAIFPERSDDWPVSTDTTTKTAKSAPTTPTTTVAGRATTTTTSTIARTAADDLAGFFSRAAELDRALKAAVASIKANMTEMVDQATVDLVQLTRGYVQDVEAAVPAGLEPDLLRALLPVFSDLVSRSFAMSGWESLPLPGHETVPLLETNVLWCLNNGSEAATRYPADLAALRTLARSSPPVADVAPDSRAAEYVALQLASIEHGNSCCEGCGGLIATELAEVTFEDDPPVDPETGARTDGSINGIPFQADFDVGLGWRFEIFAG